MFSDENTCELMTETEYGVCVCAVVASDTVVVSDPAGARRLGNASIGLSVAGIIVTVVVIVVAVAVLVNRGPTPFCKYNHFGTCYLYKKYVYSYDPYCSGVKVGGYCYYN